MSKGNFLLLSTGDGDKIRDLLKAVFSDRRFRRCDVGAVGLMAKKNEHSSGAHMLPHRLHVVNYILMSF